MPIKVNEISNKYVNLLEKKKVFKTVGFDDAVSHLKQAVEETANAAKKEIENAIEPLKSKIAQQDEFISKQQIETKKYKSVYKEAYKQSITTEIKEQKSGIANILSGILKHAENKEKISKAETLLETESQNIQPLEEIVKPTNLQPVKKKRINKTHLTTDPKIIQAIERERVHQTLDKERMNKAAIMIRVLFKDMPPNAYTYDGIQKQFQKTLDENLKAVNHIVENRYNFEEEEYCRMKFKIRVGKDKSGNVVIKQRGTEYNGFKPYKYEIFNLDGSSTEIYDRGSDSCINFKDTKGKDFLKIRYNDDRYGIFISDVNGKLMVSESIKNGVIKYMNVRFNNVKPVSIILDDALMNVYAENLIKNAKKGCKPKERSYRDVTYTDYVNSDGKVAVHEYYVNKKQNSVPIFTYLFNLNTEKLEKLISTGDFGLHAKFDNESKSWIQYSAKGIKSIHKQRPDSELKDFSIHFLKNTENEHYEVQSLYDENYELDKDKFMQREIYEKFNYGTASHPLTKSFTFYDLTKHNIKPWDFSILKPYIK